MIINESGQMNEELEECHDILIACKHSLSAAQFEYLRFRLLGTPQDFEIKRESEDEQE